MRASSVRQPLATGAGTGARMELAGGASSSAALGWASSGLGNHCSADSGQFSIPVREATVASTAQRCLQNSPSRAK